MRLKKGITILMSTILLLSNMNCAAANGTEETLNTEVRIVAGKDDYVGTWKTTKLDANGLKSTAYLTDTVFSKDWFFQHNTASWANKLNATGDIKYIFLEFPLEDLEAESILSSEIELNLSSTYEGAGIYAFLATDEAYKLTGLPASDTDATGLQYELIGSWTEANGAVYSAMEEDENIADMNSYTGSGICYLAKPKILNKDGTEMGSVKGSGGQDQYLAKATCTADTGIISLTDADITEGLTLTDVIKQKIQSGKKTITLALCTDRNTANRLVVHTKDSSGDTAPALIVTKSVPEDDPETVDAMQTFYVSPDGGGDGTKESPFSSIEQARDAVREINSNMTGDIIVYLQDGCYEVNDTMEFTCEDSGTNGYHVYYVAEKNAKPIISGGENVTGEWTEEGNGIYSIPYSRDEKLRSLYVNGKRAYMTSKQMAGKGGYGTYAVSAAEYAWAWKDGTVSNGTKLTFDETLFNTRNPEDVELESQMTWNTAIVCVDHFEDIGNGQMAAMLQMPYGAVAQSLYESNKYNPTKTQTIYNVYEWLDEPGEFYFDKSAQKLYYYPEDGVDMATAEVIVPKVTTLVNLQGTDLNNRVHHIGFRGITFAYTDYNLYELEGSHGRVGNQADVIKTSATFDSTHKSIYRESDITPSAVAASNAEYLIFGNNTFCHTATNALALVNDVTHVTMDGNSIYDVGGTSICVGHPQHIYIADKNSDKGEYSDKEKYDADVEGICQYIDITNNYIYDTGKLFWGEPGVLIFVASNLTMQYNYVEKTPYSGMSLGWGWWNMDGSDNSIVPGEPYNTTHDNIIKNNMFLKTLQILADGGAIYTLGDMPGTQISENFIKDIGVAGKESSYHIRGIHIDEGTKHVYGEKNVIDILRSHTCIDCGKWGGGVKGYNTWKDNYSTSASYTTTNNYEQGTVITDAHTVSDGYWDKDVFDIVQESGIQSSYYRDLPDSFQIQDALLPAKFKLDVGTTISFGCDMQDIDGALWLAPEGTTKFVESDTVKQIIDSKVVVPSEDVVYKLYLVKDDAVSEASVGEITLTDKLIPCQTAMVLGEAWEGLDPLSEELVVSGHYDAGENDESGAVAFVKYDVSEVDWDKVVDITINGGGYAQTTDESALEIYVLKPDVDITSLTFPHYLETELRASAETYVSSQKISGLDFTYEESLMTLFQMIKENVSTDGTISFAIANTSSNPLRLYNSAATGYPLLNITYKEDLDSEGVIPDIEDTVVCAYHRSHNAVNISAVFDHDLSTQVALVRNIANYGYMAYAVLDAGENKTFRFDRFKAVSKIGSDGNLDLYLYGTNDASLLPDNYFSGTYTEAERRSLFSEKYDLLTTDCVGKNKVMDTSGYYTAEEDCRVPEEHYRYLVILFDSWTTTYLNEFYVYGEIKEDILLGDVNGDRTITAVDALEVLITGNTVDLERGDVNGDGFINMKDAEQILEYATGNRTDFIKE
ncbi:MAG: right-handed parallel beta-helix repeat-containing protein [Lachnospiraceae bacterium]